MSREVNQQKIVQLKNKPNWLGEWKIKIFFFKLKNTHSWLEKDSISFFFFFLWIELS